VPSIAQARRPGACRFGDAKQLAVGSRSASSASTAAASCTRPCAFAGADGSSDNGAGRCHHDRNNVLVAVGIDAEHVVQFVCKHQTRSSDSNS
jgi:hypothetical protein